MKTRLLALLEKEWRDALQTRYVLYMTILLPIIFVILPVGLLFVARNVPPEQIGSELNDLPPGWVNLLGKDLTAPELVQALVSLEVSMLFMLMPMIIPLSIATYSVIGEKRERSLEPLLATPISTIELITGKSIAAAVPGVVISWLAGLVYVIAARFLAVSDRVFGVLISPVWIVMMVLLGPLLTLLATTIGLIISSRVNDPRAAEQLGALIVLPVVALFISQLTGLLILNIPVLLLVCFIVLVIDAGLVAIAAGLFQRETILTRWK